MGTFTIQAGETEKLADTTKQDASRFRAFVENNDASRARLKFSDRRKNANTGTEILGGEQVQFQLEEGDGLFAFNPTTNPVQVNVNPQGLALIDRSTVIQNASIRTDEVGLAKNNTLQNIATNESGVTSGTDTGGGTLPSNSVPDGKAVSIKAQFGNTGAVQINGDYPLLEGDSVELQVQNTDQISYTTANGTEGVAFIVEG